MIGFFRKASRSNDSGRGWRRLLSRHPALRYGLAIAPLVIFAVGLFYLRAYGTEPWLATSVIALLVWQLIFPFVLYPVESQYRATTAEADEVGGTNEQVIKAGALLRGMEKTFSGSRGLDASGDEGPKSAQTSESGPSQAVGTRIRPLQDRLIVKRLEEERKTASGIVIPDRAAEKPEQGEVKAVGKGKIQEDGKVRAIDLKVGDRVLFGKYSGQAVKVEGEELLVMREEDIISVIDGISPEPHFATTVEKVARSEVELDVKQEKDRIDRWLQEAPVAAFVPSVPSRFPRLLGAEAAKVKLALGDDPNTVRMFYGTDRARKLSPRGVVGYSWRRANGLSYGVCWVTIPAGNLHTTGKLEGPSWFKLDFSYDPKRHVTLYEIAPLDRELWLEQVNWLGEKLNTKQLLLFVHGYNVSFQDAARRTAQFVYDLEFPGVPMFYSWPSCNATLLYTFDEAAIQNAEGHIQKFIEDAANSGDFESIFLVAHSMGNRGLTAAIERTVSKLPHLASRIKHFILAAPDIDADYFKLTVAPNLLAMGLKMTMYVSSKDRALAASRWFHGWPRLGDAKKGIVVMPGIDTIDASAVDTSFMGHSPFADRKELLTDIHYLIKGNSVAQRFGLRVLPYAGGVYYALKG